MTTFEFIVLVIGLCGFAIAFIFQFQIYKHVSKEKVRAIEDPKELWKNTIPPKSVLSEKGLKLYKLVMAGIYTFVGSIVCLMLLNIILS
jgi:hypothetical protein